MKLAIVVRGGDWETKFIEEFTQWRDLHTIYSMDSLWRKIYKKMYPSVKTTTNWNDVLDSAEITRVCITLYSSRDFEYTKQALIHHKDVLVNNIYILSITQIRELKKIATANNQLLMTGSSLNRDIMPGQRYAIQKLKKCIEDGMIGDIQTINVNQSSLNTFKTNENVLRGLVYNSVSLIVSLCNKTLPESAICNENSNIINRTHYITNSILKYQDKYITLNINWGAPQKKHEITIIGTTGTLLLNYITKKLIHIPCDISTDTPKQINITYNENKSSFVVFICEIFINACGLMSKEQVGICGNKSTELIFKILDSLEDSLGKNEEIYLRKLQDIFIDKSATVNINADIGKGTKIGHYSNICAGAQIGNNCDIGQNVFIEGGAIIGNNCKIMNNVSIWRGVVAGDNVFFGPSCVLTNEINPRCSTSKNKQIIQTVIEDGVTLGANSTIICGNTIGSNSFIGAGAVVCKCVNKNAIIVGNPGKNIGCIDEFGNRQLFKHRSTYNPININDVDYLYY
tara:strand:- start:151 stop:1692 length:1542 start_codon:yes stop_codon:yes gene_type:complete